MYHMNANVNLIEQNVIQINVRMTINANMSVKISVYAKNIMFGILLHAIVKMENI